MKRVPFPRVPDSEFRAPDPAVRVSPGFTLIEITIAITIASLALVGLLGMVPQGIRTMKMATDLAIETRIHQQIISEMAQTDWDKRTNYHNMVRFYDDQGILVTESQSQSDPGLYPIVYSVRVLVPKDGAALPAKFGKSGGQSTFRAFDNTGLVKVSGMKRIDSFDGVQLVLLEICTSGLARTTNDFDKESNARSIHVYRSTLTRATKL